MARSYTDALDKLALLSSNRAVTTLFDANKKQPAQDLNSAAIPEMLNWLNRAGYTQNDLKQMRHIHVAGTKGKGSVCAFATSILQQYGHVGTYTSPHLVSPRERIAINGKPVSQELFASCFFELWDRFTAAALHEGHDQIYADSAISKPFFFRFLTILAWHIFLRQGISNVVMECGIGGEYDATNVLPPEAVSAAVISQLGIDHVAMLGDTVEKIAWHKAGILKSGVPGIIVKTENQPAVLDVLRARAVEKNAQLVEIDTNTISKWGGVEGTLKGDFQKQNQALAVFAVGAHLNMEITALADIPPKMIEGLREATIRGRCEIFEQADLTWLLDGAHTTESLEQVAKWLAQNIREDEAITLIFNQQERNAASLLIGLLKSLAQETQRSSSLIKHAIFTRNEQHHPIAGEERDLLVQQAAAEAMQSLNSSCKVEVFDNLTCAIQSAREQASLEQGPKSKILVTGSLHLVGGILLALEPNTLL